MNDANPYLSRVASYWNDEYPGKPIGDLNKKGPVRALAVNCCYLNWPVPKCCGRINEMFFSNGARNKE